MSEELTLSDIEEVAEERLQIRSKWPSTHRYDPALIQKVGDDYINGRGGVVELARRYQLYERTIDFWVRRNGWAARRKANGYLFPHRNRYSSSIWQQVRVAYEKGESSFRKLSERFGLSIGAIKYHRNTEGWASQPHGHLPIIRLRKRLREALEILNEWFPGEEKR